MRKIPAILLAAALLPCVTESARAQEESRVGPDILLSVGYKLWLNTWQTTLSAFPSQGGANYQSITKGGVPASIPNVALKIHRFLMSLSYVTTGDFKFARFSDVIGIPSAGGGNPSFVTNNDVVASRDELDLNLGLYLHRSVLMTMGYKGVFQKFKTTTTGTGVASSVSNTKTNYNGVTFGIAGSAAIAKGFSLYGNGAGGYMGVTYDPASNDNNWALYEAAELGIAWKAPRVPISMSFGYKYQIIDTFTDDTSYQNLRGVDVSRGYVLGLNYIFGS